VHRHIQRIHKGLRWWHTARHGSRCLSLVAAEDRARLEWLGRHPRWVLHLTPTSGSWLNAIETFFSALTRRRLKRGSFHSIVDLQTAINRYIAEHNADPRPFTWTKTTEQIFAKLTPLNASVH
jgi:transposase